jgi:quercetin dioxygenase-like cupin family protein
MLRIGPGEGRRVTQEGADILLTVGPWQTQHRYAILHAGNDAGWRSELNRHPHQSKVFFVLAGSYACYGDGRWLTVRAGETLLVPAGTVHGFRAGPSGGQVLVVYPGDSVGWFADGQAARTARAGHW